MNEIELVQCQSCGMINIHPRNAFYGAFADKPEFDNLAFCETCADYGTEEGWLIIEEDRALLGTDYDPEFDSANWGPDDIGLRAPCDGYWVA